MSQQDVDIVRRLLEKFQEGLDRGDPGAIFDLDAVAEDCELELARPFEGRSTYRGREEFAEFLRAWTAEFEDYMLLIERVVDTGEGQVVAIHHQHAIGRASGAPVEWHMGQVVELEAGRVIRLRNYLDPAEALAAAGVSE
jgi:ketosteroid isomerase-like protein